jgi:hypothetical protein
MRRSPLCSPDTATAGIDANYSAYDHQPIDPPDEWDDLGSFREAAVSS